MAPEALTLNREMDEARAQLQYALTRVCTGTAEQAAVEAQVVIDTLRETWLPLIARALEFAAMHPVQARLAGIGTEGALAVEQGVWRSAELSMQAIVDRECGRS